MRKRCCSLVLFTYLGSSLLVRDVQGSALCSSALCSLYCACHFTSMTEACGFNIYDDAGRVKNGSRERAEAPAG